MILIIAEKPSLARNIVAGIGELKRNNGYFEGQGYIVTWAFGHLFSLCDIEDYLSVSNTVGNAAGIPIKNAGSMNAPKPQKARWTMDTIPCFPEQFRFKLRLDKDGKQDEGVKKQFELIRSLCRRDDVDTIVNAGDADREGEIIVRLCVQNAFGRCDGGVMNVTGNKSFKRLWLPDQTPETVKAQLSDLADESNYDNLAGEGFARTYIDWLYGVNLTRYATLKTGTLLRVGRVIVPIVKAIYDRDMQIKNFVPGVYYAICSNAETNGCEIPLTSKEKFDKDKENEAKALCEKYNASEAVVTAKKTKKDTMKPGKLYSLSKLQNVLGKKFKMPMEKSLEIVQKLYEAGYLTYPRTNSEYLATAEKDKIKTIIGNVQKLGYNVKFRDDKNIFDDSKIESHSAITPTYKIPDKNKLTEDEYKVYSTVMRRFAAVFCAEPCIVQKSELTVNVGGYEDFVLKGSIVLEKGWMKYDDSSLSDKILPNLEKGDKVNIDFKPTQKETTPPKHYTIETLNNYLKNPFKEEKAALKNAAQTAGSVQQGTVEQNEEDDDSYGTDDTEEYRMILDGLELGTEATRTGIINNAINSKYIALKKDVYSILPDGEYLIESLERMKINMDKTKTSEMGRRLKKVFKGESTIRDSVDYAKSEIQEVFGTAKQILPPEEDCDFGMFGDIVGRCPCCGKDVTRTKYGYGCVGYKEGCKFSVNLVICKRIISISNAKLLIETGKTAKIKGFVSKGGKSFDAALKLQDGKAVFDF